MTSPAKTPDNSLARTAHLAAGLACVAALIVAGGCATQSGAQRPIAVSGVAPVLPIAPDGRTDRASVNAEPVTGSLLSRSYGRSALPLTIIDAEALRQQGITNSAEAINQIPQQSGY